MVRIHPPQSQVPYAFTRAGFVHRVQRVVSCVVPIKHSMAIARASISARFSASAQHAEQPTLGQRDVTVAGVDKSRQFRAQGR